ncbi:MAG: MFS transporter [Lachnospiraceae bacterium]|nr:MFS transporter [Lachnospiraceae bacterium]
MEENLKTKNKNLWCFSAGTVGRDMIYQLYTNFTMLYILFTKHLTAGQLAAITAIMIAARVFDALNDPLMGNLIEHTRSRWGKFKPWLLAGVITSGLVVFFTFNNDLEGNAFVVFFAFMYFCYSITYTMSDISYWGMIPSLAHDADSRNQFTSRATLFAGIGGTLASVLIPTFTTGSLAIGGNAKTAYGVMALIIALLTPIFMCFTLFGVKEEKISDNTPAAPISIKKIVSVMFGNEEVRAVAIVFILQQVGNGIITGGLGANYVYFTFGYAGGLWGLFTTIGMSATAVMMVVYPIIARKIDRKPLMKIMTLVSACGYACMLLIGLVPGDGMIKFAVFVLGYMAANIGQFTFYLILMISITNTVEYNELVSGSRDEAIITSLRPFITKMASAIIVLGTNLIFIISGILNETNKISDIETACNSGSITDAEKNAKIAEVIANIDPSKSIILLVIMTVASFALMYAANRIYQKKCSLDEKRYKEICEELEQRKNK